jgi:hypothetical protein
LKFADVVLDPLLGKLALYFLGRALGVDDCDHLFVNARCGFLEETATGPSKYRRVPVEPAVLLGMDEDGCV